MKKVHSLLMAASLVVAIVVGCGEEKKPAGPNPANPGDDGAAYDPNRKKAAPVQQYRAKGPTGKLYKAKDSRPER